MLAVIIVIPLAVFAFLYRKRGVLQAEFLEGTPMFKDLSRLFGALFANMWLLSTPSLLYNFFFLARRFIFALSIGVLGVGPSFQHMIQLLMSVGMVIYLVKCKPSTAMFDNKVELFNELTIFLVFTIITPYVHDSGFSAEYKYNYGFFVSSLGVS